MPHKVNDDTHLPPFETEDLRKHLGAYLDVTFAASNGPSLKVGNYVWGVYAFFDYDREPIYVGQTNERLRTRIRRHLTNQRTDAVAMSVLDPFEVYEIQVWPLPQFQQTPRSDLAARAHLDALERAITAQAIADSKFGAVLNEKEPPAGADDPSFQAPASYRARIVSDRVFEQRSHPDFRIARRALIVSRLAQVISERKVASGLRRVLVTQTQRLNWLADRRFEALGTKADDNTETDD